MLKNLSNLFSSGPYLVQFSRHCLKLTNLSTNQVWENDPLVAIVDSTKGKPIIAAIGAAAKGKTNLVVNPFDHPRVFISDFTLAEALLKYALRELMPKHFLTVSPKLILHVLDVLEGGITQLEKRALREMALGAGARAVYFWENESSPTLKETQALKKL